MKSINFNDVYRSNNKLVDGQVQRPLSTSSHSNASATVADGISIANENDYNNTNNKGTASEQMSMSQALMQNKNLM